MLVNIGLNKIYFHDVQALLHVILNGNDSKKLTLCNSHIEGKLSEGSG